jgi:hypothetical protein
MAASRPATASFERSSRIVAGGVTAGVVICLAVYWWLNEYRYAVDGGSLLFIGHTLWQPPLGWAPWLACAVLGLLALVASGLPGRNASGVAALSDPG